MLPLFDALQSRAFRRDSRLRAKPCVEISIDGTPRFVRRSTSGMEGAPVHFVHPRAVTARSRASPQPPGRNHSISNHAITFLRKRNEGSVGRRTLFDERPAPARGS